MKDEDYQYAYHQILRLHSRRLVVDDLNKRIISDQDHCNWKCITLASLEMKAVKAAMFEWPRYYPEGYSGIKKSWEHLYYVFQRKPANFNIAVWQHLDKGKVLRGLAFGDSPKGRTHLTIRWMERSYAPDYFRGGILLPILASAEQYGKLLGCKRVIIKEPHNFDEFTKYGYEIYNDPQFKGSVKKEI